MQDLGRAVLISNSTYFCEQEEYIENDTDILQCEAIPNLTSIDESLLPSGLDPSLDYAGFRCEGDATLVAEGSAWIIFERTLEPAFENDFCSLTALRPFLSNYSGFEISWSHKGQYV